MFMQSGLGSDPGSSPAMLSDPVSVTVTSATQKILVTSSKAFGTSSAFGASGGAQDLNLYVCHETGGSLIPVGGGVMGLRVAADSRHLFTLSATVTGLAPGTYHFGLCGYSSDAGSWNSNEYGYTTAFVTQ
jgi:hypothetical protein